MSYLDLLATRALLGTSRDAGALPSPPLPLADVLDTPGLSAEAAILRAAGVYCLYERAGRLAGKKEAASFQGPLDERPQCSMRAAGMLHRLLNDGQPQLLIEWLRACADSGQRPPASLWPALLDAATRRIEDSSVIRAPVAAAVGPTGMWLCRLNPEWSALVAEDASSDVLEVWQTGSKPERLATLRRQRATDPAAARELLISTFASEPAADRAAFVEALRIGLSAADEAFLEGLLADRSKEVRANAAQLLSRLPASAFVARMIERLTPLLTFMPVEPGNLLKKAKPARLDVGLPSECDESMKRDALDPKAPPGAGYGERQFWLLQMLSLTPPSHWSRGFGTSPARLLEAIPEDFADLIKMAWYNATLNAGDGDWAEALVRLGNVGKHQRLNEGLLALLPEKRRHDVIFDLLLANGLANDSIVGLISIGPLDVRSTRVLMGLIVDRARGLTVNYDHQLAQIMPRLALVAPPQLLPEFDAAWPAEHFTAAKNAHEHFFATLTIRQNIQKEFAR